MKKSLLLISFLIILFSGCTTTVKYSPIVESTPKEKSIVETAVGTEMISKMNVLYKDAIEIQANDKQVPIGIYIAQRKSLLTGVIEYYNSNSSEYKVVLAGGNYYVKPILGLGEIRLDQIDFKKTTSVEMHSESFRQTLIYTGRENNIVHFVYREFKDNYIRDSFSLDLVYDLNESRDISILDATIEILEATNSYIKFKLISNF